MNIEFPPNNTPSTSPMDYVSDPWTDQNGGQWIYVPAKTKWTRYEPDPAEPAPIPIPFDQLSDATTVDMAGINAPLAASLQGLSDAAAAAADAAATANSGLAGKVAKSNESYTVTVRSSLKTFNANTATIDQVTDVVATLISTLKGKEVI